MHMWNGVLLKMMEIKRLFKKADELIRDSDKLNIEIEEMLK